MSEQGDAIPVGATPIGCIVGYSDGRQRFYAMGGGVMIDGAVAVRLASEVSG